MTLIENDANLGFPGGCNVGIRHALERGGDYLLLLNNDATVAPDCIRRLVQAAEEEGAARILCPLVYYANPPDRIWYAGSGWDPARICNGGYRGRGERDVGQFDGIRPTGMATGAAVLIAREVLEKIGLLDEGSSSRPRTSSSRPEPDRSGIRNLGGLGGQGLAPRLGDQRARVLAPRRLLLRAQRAHISRALSEDRSRRGGRRSRRVSSASCSPTAGRSDRKLGERGRRAPRVVWRPPGLGRLGGRARRRTGLSADQAAALPPSCLGDHAAPSRPSRGGRASRR